MHDEDFDTDDILDNYQKKKKKKNSGRKGKRGERSLIEELEIRFPGKPFSRTLGSGNRWSQARLTETAKKVFTGDIVVPDNFLFALECKHGYNDISVERAIKRIEQGKRGNALLDGFLDQANKDGERVKKKPMMCWKKDYQPWIVFIKTENLPQELHDIPEHARYKEWSVLPLVKILACSDGFFFEDNDA